MPRFLCFLLEKCKKGSEPLTGGTKNGRIHFALSNRGIAQLVEQWSPKPRAEGSNPSAPATHSQKRPDDLSRWDFDSRLLALKETVKEAAVPGNRDGGFFCTYSNPVYERGL